MEPLVDVIIPCFNGSRFLGEAIDSALSQTYSRVEVTVVDDGSTDRTHEVVRNYGDRVRYVRIPHAGLSAARNAGIRCTRGHLLLFLDADDYLAADAVASHVAAARARPSGAVYYGAWHDVDVSGRPLGEASLYPLSTEPLHRLLEGYCPPCNTLVVRREVLEAVGPFDETLSLQEDWDLWLRVAGQGYEFVPVPRALAAYRRYPESMSRTADPGEVAACALARAERSVGWHADCEICRSLIQLCRRDCHDANLTVLKRDLLAVADGELPAALLRAGRTVIRSPHLAPLLARDCYQRLRSRIRVGDTAQEPAGRGSTQPRSAQGATLHWARGTSFQLFNPALGRGGPSEVDCRSLFLGSNYAAVLEAYREISRLMCTVHDVDALSDALRSSPRITRYYDVGRSNGHVSVLLRDDVFRKPRPVDDVSLGFAFHRRGAVLRRELPLARLRTLGALLPLLNGDHTEAEIRLLLSSDLSDDDAIWATELFNCLLSEGFLKEKVPVRRTFRRPTKPRVTLLSHSSLLFESERSAVVVDPLRDPNGGMSRSLGAATRMKVGAIICSHSHWDHCNLSTLLFFDKRTPIIIPRVERPSAFNPPMAEALRLLGFTDIREAGLWSPVTIEDIDIIPTPFHGEQDEPGAEIDHMTYVLRADGMTIYGGVDSYVDDDKTMDPVLAQVRDAYRPDIAFLPISKMTFSYEGGGVNGFCRYMNQEMVKDQFQYTAGPEDAAKWAEILEPGLVVPYATFNFSRLATSEPVREFESHLRSRGLDGRLFPLLPMDSLTAADLAPTAGRDARRRAVLLLFRARPERLKAAGREVRSTARALTGFARTSSRVS